MRTNTDSAAGDPTPPAAYRSTDCRIGTHPTCTEAQREQPSPDSGVRYETCTCGCHDWRGDTQ